MFSASSSDVVGSGGGITYIEDLFSTYLYTGTGATQTITNNINTSNYGGLIWVKGRSGATGHRFIDTARGATKSLESNSTAIEATESTGLTAFGTNGFTLGADADYNTSASTYVSWAFRKQPKFFDIVTYTGSGSNRTISHSLGSTPGCIIVKRLDTASDWQVYHRSLTSASYTIKLNSASPQIVDTTVWNSTAPTSLVFSVGTSSLVNASGGTYVAYIFAHNSGGFGLTGSDNVITCGSYTGNGSSSGTEVNLGYEPQWLLIKDYASVSSRPWNIQDITRGFSQGQTSRIKAETLDAETTATLVEPTSTGFKLITTNTDYNNSGSLYLYVAIRRGPMKVPTDATTVFGLSARAGTGVNATVSGGQFADSFLVKRRQGNQNAIIASRLTDINYLNTPSTGAEQVADATIFQANPWDIMDGVKIGTTASLVNSSAGTYINYLFKRSPSFFDVVCYTGTGTTNTQITHNLGVSPDLLIVKGRTPAVTSWYVLASPLLTQYGKLDTTDAFTSTSKTNFFSSDPTSTYFVLGSSSSVNSSTGDYIAYMFANCAFVSKIGSYTGTGTTNQINCGFTGGARFILIKRTDAIGAWYFWDTARGIITGNDPYLLLNSNANEVTGTDYINPYSLGFELSSTAPSDINANGGTFIYLAIA